MEELVALEAGDLGPLCRLVSLLQVLLLLLACLGLSAEVARSSCAELVHFPVPESRMSMSANGKVDFKVASTVRCSPSNVSKALDQFQSTKARRSPCRVSTQ